MKFADFIRSSAIRAGLEATDKEGVIRELVAALVESNDIPEEHGDEIVQGVLKREELGSTGIGRGVAVPHAKHPKVERPLGTVGISPQGVDFNSLDGERVHLFFLLISPGNNASDHLRALEHISQQLKEDTFCRFLKQARTVEEVQQLLEEADARQGD